MTDDQKKIVKKFLASSQSEHVVIEKKNKDDQTLTRIKCRGDRDNMQRVAGLMELSDTQIGFILGFGVEDVTISFGSADDKYTEKYPLGGAFALTRQDRDKYDDVSKYSLLATIRG